MAFVSENARVLEHPGPAFSGLPMKADKNNGSTEVESTEMLDARDGDGPFDWTCHRNGFETQNSRTDAEGTA